MDKKEKDSFLKKYLIDTAAGTISGAGGAVVTHPLDTETVKAQAGSSSGNSNFSEAKGPGSKKEKIKFKHFKTPGGRQKLKSIVRGNYAGLTPRLKKTTIAGAIGYPLFTGSQKFIEDTLEGKEKKASFAAAGRMAAKFFPSAVKGFFGVGNKIPKGAANKTAYGLGAGSMLGVATSVPKKKSTLEQTVKGIPNLDKAGTPKVTSASRSSGL